MKPACFNLKIYLRVQSFRLRHKVKMSDVNACEFDKYSKNSLGFEEGEEDEGLGLRLWFRFELLRHNLTPTT